MSNVAFRTHTGPARRLHDQPPAGFGDAINPLTRVSLIGGFTPAQPAGPFNAVGTAVLPVASGIVADLGNNNLNIPWDNVIQDDLGMYDPTTFAFTVPETGVYKINVNICVAAAVGATTPGTIVGSSLVSFIRIPAGDVPQIAPNFYTELGKLAYIVPATAAPLYNAFGTLAGSQIINFNAGDTFNIGAQNVNGDIYIFGLIDFRSTFFQIVNPELSYVEVEKIG